MRKLLLLLLILGVFSSCTSNKTEDKELSQQVDSLIKYQAVTNRYYEFRTKATVFENLRAVYDSRAIADDTIPVETKLEYIRLGQEMIDSLNLYNHLADKLVSAED